MILVWFIAVGTVDWERGLSFADAPASVTATKRAAVRAAPDRRAPKANPNSSAVEQLRKILEPETANDSRSSTTDARKAAPRVAEPRRLAPKSGRAHYSSDVRPSKRSGKAKVRPRPAAKSRKAKVNPQPATKSGKANVRPQPRADSGKARLKLQKVDPGKVQLKLTPVMSGRARYQAPKLSVVAKKPKPFIKTARARYAAVASKQKARKQAPSRPGRTRLELTTSSTGRARYSAEQNSAEQKRGKRLEKLASLFDERPPTSKVADSPASKPRTVEVPSTENVVASADAPPPPETGFTVEDGRDYSLKAIKTRSNARQRGVSLEQPSKSSSKIKTEGGASNKPTRLANNVPESGPAAVDSPAASWPAGSVVQSDNSCGCGTGYGGSCGSGCGSGCRGGCSCGGNLCSCCNGDECDCLQSLLSHDGTGRLFGRRGLHARGWLDQSFTWNPDMPDNRFNTPVTFNDRANEYQMNQLYLIVEKELERDRHNWEFGGRADVFYGTDYFFTTSLGLETRRNGSQEWNSEDGPRGGGNAALYGLAMPQLYAEVYAPLLEGMSIKMGHFYSILGHESVMAPENFFLSRSYVKQYGEPFTHTGMLATLDATSNLQVSAGFTRGWDNWEDTNDDLGALGGIAIFSDDRRSSLAFAIHTSDEDANGRDNRTIYSLVLTKQLTDRLTYIAQHDFGLQENGRLSKSFQLEQAQWYGINQYMIYQVSNCLAAGMRVEWFGDTDNARVLSVPVDSVSYGGNYTALTLGLNWKPTSCVTVRPEARWDWSDAEIPSLNVEGPYDDFGSKRQFIMGADVIVQF